MVKEEIDEAEKKNLSWVVCGFPRTKVQAMSLQHMGVVPDRIIQL